MTAMPDRRFPAWGKRDKETGATHRLAHHSADVAAVFAGLLALPVFRRRAEAAAGRALDAVDVARLSALVFLHDVGKLAPAFQARGWPEGLWNGPTRNHLETAFFWQDEATERADAALDGLLPEIAAWGKVECWLPVLFAHHGRPVRPRPRNSEDRFPILPHYDWRDEERRMGQAMRHWFASAFGPGKALPDRHRLRHFFGGLLALADWVGSDRDAFPFVAECDPDYRERAQARARRRLADIGLDAGARRFRGAPGFALVSRHPRPHPAQAAVGALPVTARLIVLEAETGSGKTEAALWRFAALRDAGAVEGLYFAVPTRAAARQLHGRIRTALTRMFENPPEAVLAIPGLIEAGAAQGARLPDWSVLWDDGAGAKNRPARWAAEHATRYLAAEVAVGTVDQAMLAALRVKHAHLRGAALSRSLLVIDEVHASDSYMSHVQGALLRAHLALGGHALLMSATLGSEARARWLGQPLPDRAEAAASPYPAVWVAGEAAARGVVGTGRARSVQVRAEGDWSGSAAAGFAIEAAGQGARVLVIRNTVKRAQESWEKACADAPELLLRAAGGPALHHGRFAAEDRALLDRAVEAALGQGTGAGGCIVIGTQTLEQSLDIDADLLIADLCPMDVLLQRIGRLHRHDRPRPAGFEAPRALILCPDDLDRLTRRAENGLGACEDSASLSGVYVNVPSLAATLERIEGEPVWRIPDMNRDLVEAATHPQALEDIAAARGWTRFHRRLIGGTLAQLGFAEQVVLNRDEALPEAYPNDERIKTRIGEEGAVVEIEGRPVGPFGAPITRIALPVGWSRGLTGEEVAVPEETAQDLVLTIGKRRFRYGRGGLEKLDAAA